MFGITRRQGRLGQIRRILGRTRSSRLQTALQVSDDGQGILLSGQPARARNYNLHSKIGGTTLTFTLLSVFPRAEASALRSRVRHSDLDVWAGEPCTVDLDLRTFDDKPLMTTMTTPSITASLLDCHDHAVAPARVLSQSQSGFWNYRVSFVPPPGSLRLHVLLGQKALAGSPLIVESKDGVAFGRIECQTERIVLGRPFVFSAVTKTNRGVARHFPGLTMTATFFGLRAHVVSKGAGTFSPEFPASDSRANLPTSRVELRCTAAHVVHTQLVPVKQFCDPRIAATFWFHSSRKAIRLCLLSRSSSCQRSRMLSAKSLSTTAPRSQFAPNA